MCSKTGHIRPDCPDLAGFKGYKCALASLAQQKGGGTATEEGDLEEVGLVLSAQSIEITRPQPAKERTTVNRAGKRGGRTWKDQTHVDEAVGLRVRMEEIEQPPETATAIGPAARAGCLNRNRVRSGFVILGQLYT